MLSTSPELFAASRVLHRLCAPRHPPSALSSLTMSYRPRLGVDASTSSQSCLVSGESSSPSRPSRALARCALRLRPLLSRAWSPAPRRLLAPANSLPPRSFTPSEIVSRDSHHRRSTLNVDFYFHACVRLILHKLFFSNRAVVFSFQRTQDKVELELIGIEPTASGLQSPRSPS